jgi:bifunctional non-homologous end joining protein LigD
LHVVAPIIRRFSWPQVKTFAKRAADMLAAEMPERYLTRISKAQRRGRIFIDYLRNDPTSTAIAPYSTRAREGARVATPLCWEEVTPKLDPGAFDIAAVTSRIRRQREDPWAGMDRLHQHLPALG